MVLVSRARLLLGLAGSALAFAVHCGFPNPSIESEDGGVAIEAGADSASTAEGGALPPDVDPAGKDQDAAVRDDASVPRPEAGPDGAPPVGCAASGADPCDCDGDGSHNKGPGCLTAGEKADCDDFDKLISPKQTSFVAEPWDPKSPAKVGDWDCDTNVLKQFAYDVKCELLNCGLEGFSGHPDCGQSGEYIFCKPVVVNLVPLCVLDKKETRTQACK